MKKYLASAAALLPTAIFCAAAVAAGFAAGGSAPTAAKSRAKVSRALKSLYTPDYLALKKQIMERFKDSAPGRFGEYVKGAKNDPAAGRKVIALTFDACGGRRGGYNAALIDYLRAEKIPATLFVTGIWLDKNPETFRALAGDPLFEVENHGLMHRICSINGRTVYGLRGTRGLGEVIDEIELNARKIEALTGRRPVFFRSAAVHADEASAAVAQSLGMELVGYDVLSGDAMRSSVKRMARNIVNGARDGAIVIMHFNHPEWRGLQALKAAVPELRSRGYAFARLQELSTKAAGDKK